MKLCIEQRFYSFPNSWFVFSNTKSYVQQTTVWQKRIKGADNLRFWCKLIHNIFLSKLYNGLSIKKDEACGGREQGPLGSFVYFVGSMEQKFSETEKPGVSEMINTSTGTYNTITRTNISVLQEIIYTKTMYISCAAEIKLDVYSLKR